MINCRTIGPGLQGEPCGSGQSAITMHGLLNDNDCAATIRARPVIARPLPEFAEGREILEILVAIQRDEVFSARFPPEQTGELAQPGKSRGASANSLTLK